MIAGILLTMAGEARAASAFISGFDDLPLMAGLSELPGELMIFDSPTGRIVENTAIGNVQRQAVETFYRDTLPQLGWERTGPGHFKREDEVLRLEFLPVTGGSGDGTSLMIHFTLRPIEK